MSEAITESSVPGHTIATIFSANHLFQEAVTGSVDESEGVRQAAARSMPCFSRRLTADGALGDFAAVATACSDDVGLLDEDRLREIAASRGWQHRFDDLVAGCGFERVGERLAVAATVAAALKSTLLSLDRPATVQEIAERAGLSKLQAAQVSGIASLTSPGAAVWVAK